jgi:hypothetical protein
MNTFIKRHRAAAIIILTALIVFGISELVLGIISLGGFTGQASALALPLALSLVLALQVWVYVAPLLILLWVAHTWNRSSDHLGDILISVPCAVASTVLSILITIWTNGTLGLIFVFSPFMWLLPVLPFVIALIPFTRNWRKRAK